MNKLIHYFWKALPYFAVAGCIASIVTIIFYREPWLEVIPFGHIIAYGLAGVCVIVFLYMAIQGIIGAIERKKND